MRVILTILSPHLNPLPKGEGKIQKWVNEYPMKAVSEFNTDRHSVDPITLEVIRHGLVSITDQIDANITRTAFSPYIYEYKDFAVGLVSADGELIAQCTGGIPVFVADSVGMAVRDAAERDYGVARCR